MAEAEAIETEILLLLTRQAADCDRQDPQTNIV